MPFGLLICTDSVTVTCGSWRCTISQLLSAEAVMSNNKDRCRKRKPWVAHGMSAGRLAQTLYIKIAWYACRPIVLDPRCQALKLHGVPAG